MKRIGTHLAENASKMTETIFSVGNVELLCHFSAAKLHLGFAWMI